MADIFGGGNPGGVNTGNQIMAGLAGGIATWLNNQEQQRQNIVMAQQQRNIDMSKIAYQQRLQDMALNRQMELEAQKESFKTNVLLPAQAKEKQAQQDIIGKQRTLTLLNSGDTAIDRNALREVAQYTNGGMQLDQWGNLIGVSPEQRQMVSFLTPISKIKNALNRASITPEYLELAKQQVRTAYGITDPKEINKRLNLIYNIPLDQVAALAEGKRQGLIQKFGGKIKDWFAPEIYTPLKEGIDKTWGELEKTYKPGSEEIQIQKITPTTITPATNELPQDIESEYLH